jgi:hypothetical protein
VPSEAGVGALIRAVCTNLRGEPPSQDSRAGFSAGPRRSVHTALIRTLILHDDRCSKATTSWNVRPRR